MAFCPAHENTRTPALCISEGDDGKLLAYCFAGCSFEQIMASLREQRIVPSYKEGFSHSVNAPEEPSTLHSPTSTSIRAQKIWLCTQNIAGTPAEAYLNSRGIDVCSSIENLLYAPICYHPSGELFSAMVGRVEGSHGFAVTCTYINPSVCQKEDVEPNKVMFGPIKGGAVRLIEGEGGLIVSEGIETCLSIQSGISPAPFSAWATLSASNMRALILPPKPSELIIAADGDPAGRQAAYYLAERAAAMGWNVAVSAAPDGKDWNDMLQEGKSWF